MRSAIDKRILARNFSRCARLYDDYANIQRIAAEELAKELGQRNFTNILEIGCGTGNYTRILKNRFENARLVAIDISEAMIEVAKKKFGNRGIEFITGDAEDMVLGHGFDLVTSNAAFQWFGDLDSSIMRYKDAVVEEGAVAFSIFGPRTFFELNQVLTSILGDKARLSANDFLSKEELASLLARYFKNFTVREKIYKEEYGSLEELLRKIKHTGVRGNGVPSSSLWARELFEDMEKLYKKRFGRIEATYEVFFSKCVK